MKTLLKYSLLSAATGLTGLGSQANAASTLTNPSTLILASSNESGLPAKISVESGYAGYSGGALGGTVSGTLNGMVTAYRFWNAVSNAPNTLVQSGNVIGDLSTSDAALSNFGSVNIWTTTASNGAAFDTTPDFTNNIGDISDFSGSVNITGLTTGSFYIIYGAYRSTPSLSISMTGSGSALDLATDPTNIHNGDFANNNEYYIARIDFTNDDGYTSLDWGTSGAANYRFGGVVLTDGIAVPEPRASLLGALGLILLMRRQR